MGENRELFCFNVDDHSYISFGILFFNTTYRPVQTTAALSTKFRHNEWVAPQVELWMLQKNRFHTHSVRLRQEQKMLSLTQFSDECALKCRRYSDLQNTLFQRWKDPFFVWNVSQPKSWEDVRVPLKWIWHPDIELYNE